MLTEEEPAAGERLGQGNTRPRSCFQQRPGTAGMETGGELRAKGQHTVLPVPAAPQLQGCLWLFILAKIQNSSRIPRNGPGLSRANQFHRCEAGQISNTDCLCHLNLI